MRVDRELAAEIFEPKLKKYKEDIIEEFILLFNAVYPTVSKQEQSAAIKETIKEVKALLSVIDISE